MNIYASWWYEFCYQWTWAILFPIFAIDNTTPRFVATWGGIGATRVLSTRFENAKQFEAFAKPRTLPVMDGLAITKNSPQSISMHTKRREGSVAANTEDVLQSATRAQCTASDFNVSIVMRA